MRSDVQSLIRSGSDHLGSGGVRDAGRDARLLLAYVLDCSVSHLILETRTEVSEEAVQQFNALIERRARREPLSHLIGRRAFWKHDFIVTKETLDPRPETESLIQEALKRPARRVLDVGTGTGAIALSLASEWPEAQVHGTDISHAALEVAELNRTALGLTNAHFHQSNWFDTIEGLFDLILSNPPYIPEDDMATLEPEVRLYEPHLALTPGGDGLEPYRILFSQAREFLAPQGRLIVEHGINQSQPIIQIAQENMWRDITVIQDLDGRPRGLCAQI